MALGRLVDVGMFRGVVDIDMLRGAVVTAFGKLVDAIMFGEGVEYPTRWLLAMVEDVSILGVDVSPKDEGGAMRLLVEVRVVIRAEEVLDEINNWDVRRDDDLYLFEAYIFFITRKRLVDERGGPSPGVPKYASRKHSVLFFR